MLKVIRSLHVKFHCQSLEHFTIPSRNPKIEDRQIDDPISPLANAEDNNLTFKSNVEVIDGSRQYATQCLIIVKDACNKAHTWFAKMGKIQESALPHNDLGISKTDYSLQCPQMPIANDYSIPLLNCQNNYISLHVFRKFLSHGMNYFTILGCTKKFPLYERVTNHFHVLTIYSLIFNSTGTICFLSV